MNKLNSTTKATMLLLRVFFIVALCFNNKAAKTSESNRAHSCGIYYHFDYISDPKQLKVLYTTQI